MGWQEIPLLEIIRTTEVPGRWNDPSRSGTRDGLRFVVWSPIRVAALAIGAYGSGALSLARSLALASMSALMLGTLKGTSPRAPCPALIQTLAAAAVIVLSVVLGQLG